MRGQRHLSAAISRSSCTWVQPTRQCRGTVLPYIRDTHGTWIKGLKNTLSFLPHPFAFLSVDVATHRQCRNDFKETASLALVGSMWTM
ncbi:hypothetical protein SCLCIDRAFT_608428 [Scleroderma citrinum Foug A]|uniref:Uncharacterized protein n=1 Tax=Scleroderma citrinum Foug A TaxID=1036808 RepID=A0A0C2ZSP0_9AGAM|nr:hypothetical protein SCLCIDRAFT_608428 [Scleroderma citrinum Foug A]